MKKTIKESNAITLIALIITIIVLLILAGVAINMTLGNDGIISKAQSAADVYKNAQEKEEVMLNAIDKLVTITYHDGDNKYSEIVRTGNTVTLKKLTKDGYIFKGWSLMPDGDIIEESEYQVREDIDFFAIWNIDIDTVDEGDLSLPNPDSNSFGSAYVYYEPKYAFDKDESTYFFPDIDTNAMNLYVGYNYQKLVKCYKVEISFGKDTAAPDFDYQIEGLKADGTWEPVSGVLTCNDQSLHVVTYTTNQNPHTSYRLKGLTNVRIHAQNHYAVTIKELKFYCLE